MGFAWRSPAASARGGEATQTSRTPCYRWDRRKADSNLRKHGIAFADAVALFSDDAAITIEDDGSSSEKRFITLGVDALGRVLVVVYAWRGSDTRILSARGATARERQGYEGQRA